jgi:hypothetical protein
MDTVALIFAVAGIAAPIAASAEDAPQKNWFNDPFFAASADIADCPVPRGPSLTKTEMEREAHVRVERGTRCYMEGRCAKSSSYFYDPEIAANLRHALANSKALKGTSLWVSVQRRWVFIQGCAKARSKRAALEAIARRIPDVDNVFVDLRFDPKQPPPYPALQR